MILNKQSLEAIREMADEIEQESPEIFELSDRETKTLLYLTLQHLENVFMKQCSLYKEVTRIGDFMKTIYCKHESDSKTKH